MANFHDAESRGLNLDRALPALVQGRTLNGADDVAALLYGRVAEWLDSAGDRRQADRVEGLFPATRCVTNRDADRALQDRCTLIDQNARTLLLNALQRQDPWTCSLGRPPTDPVLRQEWLGRFDTIAAYPRSREQLAQWQAGQYAICAALDAMPAVNTSGNVREQVRGLELETR